MDCAQVWARRSTCSRNHVGVVIASPDYRIIGTGFNGAPKGMSHCNHRCTCRGGPRETKMTFGHEGGCPYITPCKIAVHGEANAIAFAARNGIALAGAKLFSTLEPCYPCSQLIINSGVVEVYYLESYRSHEGLDLLRTAGIDVVKF